MPSNESTNQVAVPPTVEQYIALLVYVAFVIVSTVGFIAILVSSTARGILGTSFGWPGSGFFYVGTLIYAIPPLLRVGAMPTGWCLQGIQGSVFIFAIYGAAICVLESVYLLPDDLRLGFLLWLLFTNVCIPAGWYLTFRHLRNAEA